MYKYIKILNRDFSLYLKANGETAPITKALIKFFPHFILGAAMVYQTVENHQLEIELEVVNYKMTKVPQIMLNITDIEYATVNKELTKVINQQRQISAN